MARLFISTAGNKMYVTAKFNFCYTKKFKYASSLLYGTVYEVSNIAHIFPATAMQSNFCCIYKCLLLFLSYLFLMGLKSLGFLFN